MSQIIRATRSPDVPVHGKIRNVDRSGFKYMSDSSIRTKPSIDDPSNMILPSSASSNCRSGISTFLIVPRMSVNCRRMNLTFSRSVRSMICALVSLGAPPAGAFVLAMPRILANFSGRTFVSRQKGDLMRLIKLVSVVVAAAGLGLLLLIAAPSAYRDASGPVGPGVAKATQDDRAQSDRSEPRRPRRELTSLSGRG